MKFTIPTMDDGLRGSFEDLFQHGMTKTANGSLRARYSTGQQFSLDSEAREAEIAENVQRALRPHYGKGSPLPSCIGDHPDFLHLKGTDEVCYCPITTMFMDIESSTRLSLLYPLEDVRRIKNAFIQLAIQIIRCFDGHVHRIMGDAVMAYFGGVDRKVEDAIVDGINCASALQFFAENVVRPQLDSWGYGNDFGIRVGLDHGGDDKVLWGSYGYDGMEEVTATSFYVDVASKLQNAAPRNQTMMGGSLVDSLDFPEELIETKTVSRNGEVVPEPYLLPNHAGRDGRSINYRQWQLSGLEYLRCTPVAQWSPTFTHRLAVKPARVFCTVHATQESASEGEYHAGSRTVPKKKWLKFTKKLPYMPMLPYTIKCRVENHGKEATTADPVNRENHSETYTIQSEDQHKNFKHWETTSYRGLHYLTVEVYAHNKLTFQTRFGVYVA